MLRHVVVGFFSSMSIYSAYYFRFLPLPQKQKNVTRIYEAEIVAAEQIAGPGQIKGLFHEMRQLKKYRDTFIDNKYLTINKKPTFS